MDELAAIHPARTRSIASRLASWFDAHARALPWRTNPRDPYRSLVSEIMLQQTQAARVAERFEGFVARFPDLRSLASADEPDVLAAWSGLGYYRRARALHAAARQIVQRFDARVPSDPGELRSLPGVGAYTAGALASIVFGHPSGLVDANAARVLLRVEGHDVDPSRGPGHRWVWDAAERLARIAHAMGTVAQTNEGLMELGAIRCTPRTPRCACCPLVALCRAHAAGTQERIPRPPRRIRRTPVGCATALITDHRGRVLVERRSDDGLWSGLWQAPTVEQPGEAPGPATLRDHLRPLVVGALAHRCGFDHATTHRAVRFEVYTARARPTPRDRPGKARRWIHPADLGELGVSSPQRRILLGRTPDPVARA